VTPSAPRGALSALGGVLAVLQAGDGRDTAFARAADMPEARLATALEGLVDESDADVPMGHEGLAAPLAASLGAPLLAPLAEALRSVGARRAEHATQLQAALVDPLHAFVQTSLRGVEAARYTYGRRSRDADLARESYLRQGGADSRARAAAAEAHADAALARDAARAALAAAVCHAEGARRHAVLDATVGALQALREHAQAVVAELDNFTPAIEAAQAYAAQAAVQAEKRAAAQSEANEAFMTARQAESEAAKLAAPSAAAPTPNDGRSDAGAALRQTMASHREATPAAAASPPPLKESYLMLRAAGGWHKRYFVLDAGGTLAFHRTRDGALAAARGRLDGATKKTRSRPASAAAAPTLAEEATAHDSDAASGDEQDEEDDATALARAAIGSMWSMGSSLLRGAVSNAVSGARSLAETAGELATAAGQRVAAPSGGALMLLTASVKMGAPETDAALASLPFIFRVMSPVPGGSLVLQAESAAERAAWVAALQGVVAELLTGSGRRDGAPAWASLRAAPGNSTCADCGAADPDWASLNLCVLLCQQCAGAHRRLGAAASAVRSLNLDEDAWTPSVVALFAAHGNAAANAVFAAVMQEGDELQPDSPMEARLELVRSKYVERLFVDPAAAEAAAQPGALSAAAAGGDVAAVLRLLAAGADPNGAASGNAAPLAAAAAAGSLLAAQALLLNGADACAADAGASTPADLAASSGGADAAALQSLLQAAAARRAHGRTLISGKPEAAPQVAPQPAEPAVEPAAEPAAEPTAKPAVEPAAEPAAESASPAPSQPVEPAVAASEPPAVAATPARVPPPAAAQPRTPAADDDDEWLDDAAPEATPGGSKLAQVDVDEDWVA